LRKPVRIGLIVILCVILLFVLIRVVKSPSQENAGEEGNTTMNAPSQAEIDAASQAGSIMVTISTTKGDIKATLRGDLMPLTTANFVKLASSGFYDGLRFHRVEDWVIQAGDPVGDGTGGPGYAIKFETHPELKNVHGAVAMARRPNNVDSAGSQFYILRTDASWLDGDYAVFGHVTDGMDVVDKMEPNDLIKQVSIAPSPI